MISGKRCLTTIRSKLKTLRAKIRRNEKIRFDRRWSFDDRFWKSSGGNPQSIARWKTQASILKKLLDELEKA